MMSILRICLIGILSVISTNAFCSPSPVELSEFPEGTVVVFTDKKTAESQKSIMVEILTDGSYQFKYCHPVPTGKLSLTPVSTSQSEIKCPKIDNPITQAEIDEINRILHDSFAKYELAIHENQNDRKSEVGLGMILGSSTPILACFVFKKCTAFLKTNWRMLTKGPNKTDKIWPIFPTLALVAMSTAGGKGIALNLIADDTNIISEEYTSATGLDSIIDQEKLLYIELVMKTIVESWTPGDGDKMVLQGTVQSIDVMNALLSEIFLLRDSITHNSEMAQ